MPGVINCPSGKKELALVFTVATLSLASPAMAQTSDLVDRTALRVCADPANVPFTNRKREGFENKIAELIAAELHLPVTYTWFPQTVGFVRRTLGLRKCDIIMGFVQGHEMVLNTNHYYRSTYVMIVKKGNGLDGVKSLDDPRLKTGRIGVIAGTPPATVLAINNLLDNVKPYRLTVDRRHFAPAERMVEDVAAGKIDMGLLWGPIAGYYNRKTDGLTVIPLLHETKGPRMVYRITFGIRPGERAWKRKLNEIISSKQEAINSILLEFGVPLLDEKNNRIQLCSSSGKTTNGDPGSC